MIKIGSLGQKSKKDGKYTKEINKKDVKKKNQRKQIKKKRKIITKKTSGIRIKYKTKKKKMLW